MELRSGKKPKVAHQPRQPRHTKVVTILAQRTSMTDLPPEVLREIFLWSKYDRTLPGNEIRVETGRRRRGCGYPRTMNGYKPEPESEKYWGGVDFEIDPNTVNPNEENPSYKSFRRVCRLWHHIVTPLLFETITLLRHTDSWARADSICGCPRLARHVRRLQVDANELRTVEVPERTKKSGLSKKTWRFNRDFPWLDFDESEYASYKVNGGPLAKLSEDEESAYNRYKPWRQGELAMVTHHRNGTTPRLRLELLDNLQRVETVIAAI